MPDCLSLMMLNLAGFLGAGVLALLPCEVPCLYPEILVSVNNHCLSQQEGVFLIVLFLFFFY